MFLKWSEKVKSIKCICGINTFNNELTIYACLQQAIKNFNPSDIFIFDDGSSDRTLYFIDKFNKDHGLSIMTVPVGEADPWPDQKVPRDHGPDKGTLIETGKTHAKSKFKSWYVVKANFPDAIYFSLEADVLLTNDALNRAKSRIAAWEDPKTDCEFFNVVFTIDRDYVRPMCSTEESLDDRLEGIQQRKVYDQPGDWTFACFWTGGNLEIGPDPVWPYGACLFPWTQKNQLGKKGQDTDNPYGFHLYNYNNNHLEGNFKNGLILKISDLQDDKVDWTVLYKTWYPKILRMNDKLVRCIEQEYEEK